MPKKQKTERRRATKDRISLRDAVMPAAVLTLAAVEKGSQGGVPVLEELTTYVVDNYDTTGFSGAAQQVGVGLGDLVSGAVSIEGVAILGGAYLLREYLGHHGRRLTVAKTAHHRFSVGG